MINVLLTGLLIVIWSIYQLFIWFKQFRCKHDGGITETMACDAICRKCGKNLGFIANWRKKNVDTV